jgi:hypothetical protein
MDMTHPFKTFAPTVSSTVLFEDTTYVLVRVQARPLTAGLAPLLIAFLAELAGTDEQEKQLVIDDARTEFAMVLSDDALDHFVDSVVNSLLTITGGKRDDALYVHFLGSQKPFQLKNPVLGPELEKVRGWLPSLETSPHAILAALAPAGAQLVAEGDKAQLAFSAAHQALKDFREVGARVALVAKANALFSTTYGALGDIAHSHPEANLPKDFADGFFRHDHRRRTPLSSEELGVKVAAAEAALRALQAERDEAKADEAKAAADKAKKEAAARQKVIDDAQKKADDAAAKLAALKQ